MEMENSRTLSIDGRRVASGNSSDASVKITISFLIKTIVIPAIL